MKVIDVTHGRSTYSIELTCSTLFEAALGIAAVTNPEIHPSLEKPLAYWNELHAALPPHMQRQLSYVQQHNTWKTLLQLLHQQDFADLPAFLSYIAALDPENLRYKALPFLGSSQQANRAKAAGGDGLAAETMIDSCREHKFFPAYIRFICQVDAEELREHLLAVMAGWYQTQIAPHREEIAAMLARDISHKRSMLARLSAEQFIEWATGGIEYPAEPDVTRVLLIPHYIYRPWNVQAAAEGTTIFYYPLADDSLAEDIDVYRPPLSLVQRHKALSDEHRLRLLKLLYEREHTLQELTDKLALSKSTVHHHLSMLRSAQLVTGDGTKYRCKLSSLELMHSDLQHYLQRRSGTGGI